MPPALTRRDILDNEQRLREDFSKVLTFTSHAVYFPLENLPPEPQWIPEEETLLLPLAGPPDAAGQRELLGVFAARQVSGVTDALLEVLPGIADICLNSLAEHKKGRLDPVTGLATRHVMVEQIGKEIASIQSAFSGGEDIPAGGSLGILCIRLAPLRDVAREHGQTFAEQLALQLAEAFSGALPEGALAGRIGDTSFAAFIPAATRQMCEQAAHAALEALDGVSLPSPLSRQKVGVLSRAGIAMYPQDLDGIIIGREPYEQTQRLVQRAALAAAATARNEAGPRILSYGRMLHEGGTVLRILPFSRVVLSLGRTSGAREGQRFALWARPREGDQAPAYKGELSIIKVYRDEAEAEIIHLGEPGNTPTAGDMLTLLPESGDAVPSATGNPDDPDTGMLRHGDFLARLASAQHAHPRFGLVLVHLAPEGLDETALPLAARLISEHFQDLPENGQPTDAFFGGRYGHTTLVFFHANIEPEVLQSAYASIAALLAEQTGRHLAAGIAMWPFLQFRPADIMECARKALEYAKLLPAPHVGVFDSLALNISADKRHCVGDTFGAVEEYKLALLADPDNALAWNSLGVCMAGIGRAAEARRYFEEAMARTPGDPALAYNLGAVCLNLGDTDAAEKHFRACLAMQPEHLYAQIRLGQVEEQRGRFDAARRCYELAVRLDERSGLPFRHLARLCLRQESRAEAREFLHQALRCNPRDAIALQLMAGLYLDGGEDPALAESLARNSVALMPERKPGWLVLARALEKQNRHEESTQALIKAGEL